MKGILKMKRIISLLVVCMTCVQFGVIAFAAEATNLDTKISNKDYYSEQVSSVGEDSINIITNESVKNQIQSDLKSNGDLRLVSSVEKTVYVSESVDKNGNVIDSHLMDLEEVTQYKENLNNKV
jgi:hypothetical protein